jgi:GxxExxY protein
MELAESELEDLKERVIGCAIEVHRSLGPGLTESIYRDSLLIELIDNNFDVVRELCVPVEYKGRRVGGTFKIDLLVSGMLVVEVKSVDLLHPVHQAQVITYLKLTGYPAGLLMNFNATTLRAGLKRVDHPDRYLKKLKMKDVGESS